MTRDEIIALVRETYDPEPHDWPRHRGWDDGAGDIADKILERPGAAQCQGQPLAWRFEAAKSLIWGKDGKPGVYADWEWRVSATEPNMGDGMRNVTPLYAVAVEQPTSPAVDGVEQVVQRIKEACAQVADRAAERHADNDSRGAMAEEIAIAIRALIPASLTSRVSAPVAWRSTTPAFRQFITQETYDRFSPEARKWYEPFRCATCVAPSPALDPATVEACANIADLWVADWGHVPTKHLNARYYAVDAVKDIAEAIRALAGPVTSTARASDPNMPPVCCYCDHDLSCAHCGMEQPPDNGAVSQTKRAEQ